MICPWCEFPITGVPSIPRFTESGRESAGYNATCKHCHAIIRVEVTTLKTPDVVPLRTNVTEQQEAARKHKEKKD